MSRSACLFQQAMFKMKTTCLNARHLLAVLHRFVQLEATVLKFRTTSKREMNRSLCVRPLQPCWAAWQISNQIVAFLD
jgi:hypothetical protein